MAGNLTGALAELEEEASLRIARERLDAGDDPFKILADARRGMEIVGRRFAEGYYYIPDLIYSGEILKQVSGIVSPRLAGSGIKTEKLGRFIIGTVAGDIHDIGKDIVAFMLDINSFEVYDLGVDVPKEKFVEKVKETGANIVGLSGFLTLAFDSMKETVAAIEAAGLRDKVKIMIGGGQINQDIARYTGADGYGKDAMEGVTLAKKWIQER